MLKIKFRILRKTWTIKLNHDIEDFAKQHGDACAVTMGHARKIELSIEGLDKETITHELVHAYLYEMCLGSTNRIKAEDMEEICAELFAKRGKEILRKAAILRKKVKKLTTPQS